MAGIDDAIFAALTASVGITAIASSTGCYNLQSAQGCDAPYLVFTVLPSGTVDSLDGVSTLTSARLQIDSYANTKDGAMLLAKQVCLQMGGFRGFSNGIYITRCLGPRAGWPAFETETRLYREMREFSLGYYESTA